MLSTMHLCKRLVPWCRGNNCRYQNSAEKDQATQQHGEAISLRVVLLRDAKHGNSSYLILLMKNSGSDPHLDKIIESDNGGLKPKAFTWRKGLAYYNANDNKNALSAPGIDSEISPPPETDEALGNIPWYICWRKITSMLTWCVRTVL